MKIIKLSVAILFVVGLTLTSCEKHGHHPKGKGHECGNHHHDDDDADDTTTPPVTK